LPVEWRQRDRAEIDVIEAADVDGDHRRAARPGAAGEGLRPRFVQIEQLHEITCARSVLLRNARHRSGNRLGRAWLPA
jgi:hypothetical protein